jgi:phosphatidylglycerol lysyltransferase
VQEDNYQLQAAEKKKGLFRKLGWKEVLAVIFILVAAYFFWKERGELKSLGASLALTDPGWLTVGIIYTVAYLLLQAGLYIYSFYSVKGHISLLGANILFLKRNVIAVFLPGGGLTALAYVPSGVVAAEKDRNKVHHASVIYGFIGIFSVFIVAIPVLLYLWVIGAAVPGTAPAFITVVVMLSLISFFVKSVQQKGKFYKWAIKGRPKIEKFLLEVFSFDLDMKQFLNATIVSVLIEIVGVIHIYLSMLAAGVEPNWEASIVAYIIATIFLIISPFLRGMGAIEVSLTLILKNYGYSTVESLQIALLFRFFEFWLPLLGGLFTYSTKIRKVF